MTLIVLIYDALSSLLYSFIETPKSQTLTRHHTHLNVDIISKTILLSYISLALFNKLNLILKFSSMA